MKLEDLC